MQTHINLPLSNCITKLASWNSSCEAKGRSDRSCEIPSHYANRTTWTQERRK